jgi:transposase-like protein
MTQLNITLDEGILKELMLGNRDDAVRKLLEVVFDAVLQAEATEQLGAEQYERSDSRITYRNGFRTRILTTRVGSLTLHVPKFRDGTFSTQLFRSYARSEQALLLSLMEMVIQGVSTRKVTEVTEVLCGTSFSKSTVSALCKQLDPAVENFKNRSLETEYPFVIVDALYMKARERGAIRSKGMLIATGINRQGKREVLGFQAGDGESYETWSEFFLGLKARGLHGVDLVTSDNHGGLVKAIKEQFCGVMWQRCQTHFSRNVLDKVPKKQRSDIHAKLTDMYNSPSLKNAYKRRDFLLKELEILAPKAAIKLDEGFDDITAVFSLPKEYRKRLRTSNSIERLNEEIRRRERVIRIFPNEDSINRLIGTLLIEQHEKWISGKSYFNMDNYFDEKEQARKDAEKVRQKRITQVA